MQIIRLVYIELKKIIKEKEIEKIVVFSILNAKFNAFFLNI